MKSFFSALKFLTLLPIPDHWVGGERELSRSVWFFPLVGALIGLGAVVLDQGLSHGLPIFPESVLMVIFLTAVSGGLHMDGLSDTADGFLSSRPRERILEIMKDSRVGAMGVMAVVVLMLLKVSLLVSLETSQRQIYLFLVPLVGRTSFLFPMALSEYVRKQSGLGRVFESRKRKGWLIWGCLWIWIPSTILLGKEGVLLSVILLGVTGLFVWMSCKKIGGWTGDTLGALCELSEIFPLLMGVMVMMQS